MGERLTWGDIHQPRSHTHITMAFGMSGWHDTRRHGDNEDAGILESDQEYVDSHDGHHLPPVSMARLYSITGCKFIESCLG